MRIQFISKGCEIGHEQIIGGLGGLKGALGKRASIGRTVMSSRGCLAGLRGESHCSPKRTLLLVCRSVTWAGCSNNVLWTDETKIEAFGFNENSAFHHMNHIPTVSDWAVVFLK